jgi:hypothetical protein
MTSQSPRIYTYKITFEEVPYYYYGSKKEKYFDEEYWGSPITHKWMWDFYTPKKKILELFDYTDEGYIEMQEVEKRLIRPVLNDKWCLNENVSGTLSINSCRLGGKIVGNRMKEEKKGIHALTFEERSENGKKSGKIVGLRNKENKTGVCGMSLEELIKSGSKGGTKTRKLGKGIYARTKQEMQEHGRKNGLKTYEKGTGIHSQTSEEKSKNGKRGAEKAKKLGLGIYAFTSEEQSKYSKMGGRKTYEQGKGCFSLTPEEKSELAKRNNAQKWMCLETGYVSNSGGLSRYQKKRGIDTTKRVRIS